MSSLCERALKWRSGLCCSDLTDSSELTNWCRAFSGWGASKSCCLWDLRSCQDHGSGPEAVMYHIWGTPVSILFFYDVLFTAENATLTSSWLHKWWQIMNHWQRSKSWLHIRVVCIDLQLHSCDFFPCSHVLAESCNNAAQHDCLAMREKFSFFHMRTSWMHGQAPCVYMVSMAIMTPPISSKLDNAVKMCCRAGNHQFASEYNVSSPLSFITLHQGCPAAVYIRPQSFEMSNKTW